MYNNNLDTSNNNLLDNYSNFLSNESACSPMLPMLTEAIRKSKTFNKNHFVIGDSQSRIATGFNSGVYAETELLKNRLGDTLIQKYIVRPTDTLKSVYDRICPNSFTNQGISFYDAFVNTLMPQLPPRDTAILNKMIQKAKDSGQNVYFKKVSDYSLSDSNFKTESQDNNSIGVLRLYGLDIDKFAANPNDDVVSLSAKLYGSGRRQMVAEDQVISSQLQQAPLESVRQGNALAGDTFLQTPTFQTASSTQPSQIQFSEPITVVRGNGASSSTNAIKKTFVFLEDYKDVRQAATSTGAVSVKDYKKGDFAEFEVVRNESQSEPPMFALTPLGNRIGYGGRGQQVIQEVKLTDSLEKTTENKMKINPAILVVAGIVLLGGIIYLTKK